MATGTVTWTGFSAVTLEGTFTSTSGALSTSTAGSASASGSSTLPDSASFFETVTSVDMTLPSSSFFTTDSVPVAVSWVMVCEPSGLVTVVVVEPSWLCSTSVLSDGVGGTIGAL